MNAYFVAAVFLFACVCAEKSNETRTSKYYPSVTDNDCAQMKGLYNFWADLFIGQGRVYINGCDDITFYYQNAECSGKTDSPCLACANINGKKLDKKVFSGPDFEINSFITSDDGPGYFVDFFCTVVLGDQADTIGRIDCTTEFERSPSGDEPYYSDPSYSETPFTHVTFTYKGAELDADLPRKEELYQHNHRKWRQTCKHFLKLGKVPYSGSLPTVTVVPCQRDARGDCL